MDGQRTPAAGRLPGWVTGLVGRTGCGGFGVTVGGILAAIWVPIYATVAFRRVYGGSLMKTIAKEVGIGAIYTVVSGIAFVVMIYWVSIAT